MTAGTAELSCEVFVDGQRLADTAEEYLESTPTALGGLKVTWGRSTVIDQPDTSSCSFTVRDKDGDADFLGLLHTGHPVTVRAAGGISTGEDPVDIAVDGWFETTTPTQRAYINATVGTVTATDDAYSGDRALRIAALTAGTAYIGPAPFSSAVDAWDDIPKTAADQTWTVRLMVKPAAAARTSVAPYLPTTPTRGLGGKLLAGKVAPAGGGWVQVEATWTVAAADPPGTWVGAAVTLDQYTAWVDWPGTWVEQTLTWQDLGSVIVDQLEVLAPPSAQRRVLVFSGRITSLEVSPAAPSGVEVAVNAVDWTADLANDNIGDDPWPAETVKNRVARILRLASTPVTTTIAAFPAAQKVSWLDIDSQPVMDLLSDLAVSADAVLWSAWTSSRGFYLWWEDPALRTALRLLTLDPDTGLIVIVGNPSPSEAIYLTACQIARDPIRLSQDVTDVITRVDLTWQEQTLDDDGLPSPTDRHIIVVDQVAEAEFGVRRVGYSTQLTTQAAGQVVADRVLNRSRAVGWKSEGFTWDTRIPTEFDDTLRGAALDLLDGTKRIGAPIVVDQMPDWSPTGRVFGAYLEGGNYTFTGGRWVLDMSLSPSGMTGQSARWVDMDPAWTWAMFNPDLAWFQLLGTTTNATDELEAA